jgi:RimJ/RimL family protein N-acetyltransferase
MSDFKGRYDRAVAGRPELLTARLCLRRPTHADASAIVAVCGRREVALRLGRVPHPYGEEDARVFLDTVVPRDLVWGIFLRDETTLIGMIGLHLADGDADALQFGYYLDPGCWDLGLATEAGSAVTAFGLGLGASIVAWYFADNLASGRVLAKLGFRETGRTERPCLASGLRHASIEVRR